jgi:rhamnogalacturonyl hydrolase YesR
MTKAKTGALGKIFFLSFGLAAICGIQATAQATEQEALAAVGGMARYISTEVLDTQGKSRCDYNMIEGKWYPYEVPWHTGQAVLALLRAYELTGNTAYLSSARKGGDFWISLKMTDRPGLDGMVDAVHGDVLGSRYVVFATISDGTPGIYELSRVTGDPVYARVATGAASWMYDHMYYAEKGVCYDCLDMTTGKVLKENSPFWKDKIRTGPTLYDVSRPNTEGYLFKDAYEFSGQKKFRDAFINLCNSLLEKQGPEGVWMAFTPNDKANHSFHPRFSLWYAESLIKAYQMTGNRKYLDAAAKTARVFARAQMDNGTIFYVNYTDGRPPDRGSVTGSAVSFAGIVWIDLVKEGYREFTPYIERSAAWIIKNRYAADYPNPNLRGAVLETRIRFKKNKIWLTNRDIGTSFALRFMVDYLEYKYHVSLKKPAGRIADYSSVTPSPF